MAPPAMAAAVPPTAATVAPVFDRDAHALAAQAIAVMVHRSEGARFMLAALSATAVPGAAAVKPPESRAPRAADLSSIHQGTASNSPAKRASRTSARIGAMDRS